MDSHLKIFAKSFYYSKDVATAFTSISKPLSKTFSSVIAKPSTFVGVIVIASVLNMSTRTHSGPIKVLTTVYRRPIFQEEKDCQNRLGFCCYCGKPGYIAIYYKNSVTFATKR